LDVMYKYEFGEWTPLLKCLSFKTVSYINYELEILGGPGFGHGDTSCDVVTMTLRVPRG
jgi:hypothetical protein